MFFLFFSLWQIEKEGNACSSSSAVIKALRSVLQIRRKSRNGFKVLFSAQQPPHLRRSKFGKNGLQLNPRLMGMFPVSCCVSAIQTCIQQLSLGLLSPHREARLRRKELRQKQQVDVEDLEEKMKQLQAANEHKQKQLEEMRKVPSSEAL